MLWIRHPFNVVYLTSSRASHRFGHQPKPASHDLDPKSSNNGVENKGIKNNDIENNGFKNKGIVNGIKDSAEEQLIRKRLPSIRNRISKYRHSPTNPLVQTFPTKTLVPILSYLSRNSISKTWRYHKD